MINGRAPYVIGITGTIGSGKSFVGRILEERGVPVIDTDKVVHDLFALDGSMRTALVERFGEGIVAPSSDGAIDRTRLGELVFRDATARKDLEAIVHPATISECRKRISQLGTTNSVVAVLVPLLFEARVEKDYDEIWSVLTDETVLRQRLKGRDKLSDEQIDQRLSAQWDQARKAALSQRVIDNSGTEQETRKQVLAILDETAHRHDTP